MFRKDHCLPTHLGLTMSSSSSSAANGGGGTRKKHPKNKSPMARFFALMLLVCSLISLSINYLHEHPHDDFVDNPKSAVARSMKEFVTIHKKLQIYQGTVDPKIMALRKKEREEQRQKAVTSANTPSTRLATLQCEAYGGPSPEIAQEMVYWSDIPSDASYKSPFHSKRGQQKQYMTFEPDGGGWNNIRMAMETVFALAHAMGRTLVMPAEQRMYLLFKQDNQQKHHFGFADFFPIQELAQEHDGLEIISMQTFLEREAMTGNLRDKTTGQVSFPPFNRTDWNGQDTPHMKMLKEWLRNVTHVAMWRPMQCMAAFPATTNHSDVVALRDMLGKQQDNSKYAPGRPVPVDAPPEERMREVLGGRNELCLYDETMQKEFVVHFMCYHKMRIRLLVHFYQFLFFEDWKQDLWTKRFIRDHVRYIDEIQCAAARVVHAIRQRSKQRGNEQGSFDSFQIRRGDFQYKNTRIPANEIYENSKNELIEGATVYIATDERNRTFFQPLKDHYDIVFLNDFKDEIKGLNTNYYGMVEQLVASRGNVFFGCWFSTFTGYITRMRGYHSVKDQLVGYEEGLLPNTYYYALKDKKNAMLSYAYSTTFAREFPISWRDIDRGIGMLSNNDVIVMNGTTTAAQARV